MTILYLLEPLAADAQPDEAALVAHLKPHSALSPAVSVFDQGAARGDGVFETIGVVGGRAQGVAAHLERLEQSAGLLDLPAPNLAQWQHAISRVEADLRESDSGHRQAGIRLVITRGFDAASGPSAWITATPATSDFLERERGIAVVTLDRGFRSDVGTTAPWLLTGAKTLSYAPNMAALREARRRGADDAIFVSSDGIALEGPTSSLIARFGQTIVTPRTDLGILAGTTQLDIFEIVETLGFETEYVHLPAADLVRADALWLVSSVRLAAPIRELDGTERDIDHSLTSEINTHLLSR